MLRFGYILGEMSAGFGWSSRNSPAANKTGADELLPASPSRMAPTPVLAASVQHVHEPWAGVGQQSGGIWFKLSICQGPL